MSHKPYLFRTIIFLLASAAAVYAVFVQVHATPQMPEVQEVIQPMEQSVPQPDEAEPENLAQPQPEPEPERYDFTQPAPEREPVENEYFQDAAFIGDSRTDGFMIYSGIGCGENLTSNGLSIFRLGEGAVFRIGGEKMTLPQALERKEYGKVYLSLGVNELGIYNDEGFYQSYLEAIDLIRTLQPQAVIYIQGLIPVNEEVVAASGGGNYLKNDHLRVYNDLMRQAAQEKQVVFLDLYTEFVDENGSLPADASRDGVHLHRAYCEQWLSYLQRHTVEPELLGLEEAK